MEMVWPFVPQIAFKEVLTWTTDVIRCKETEQRISIRKFPRTEFDYKFHFLPQQIETATRLSRDIAIEGFQLPIWSDAEPVVVTTADTVISIATNEKRFIKGGFLFIIGLSGEYEIAQIEEVSPVSVTIASPGIVNSYGSALAMPCTKSFTTQAFKFNKYSADYTTGQLTAETTDVFPVTGENNYPAYKGAFVLTDRPVISGATTESHNREKSEFPSVAGPLYFAAEYSYAISKFELSWSFDNKAQLWTFRKWLYSLQGKQKAFYTPRWTRDFIVASNTTSGNLFLILEKNSLLTDNYKGPIAIVKKDGTVLFNSITIWADNGATMKAFIETSMGVSINKDEIELVCRMPKVRSDADSIELAYEPGGHINVRIPLIEVPE
jgi:hypothetical protein